MPINDPIQNRKVAPGSLAFERRRMVYGTAYAGEEPEGDVYNYQYYIDLNYNITINNIVTKPMLDAEVAKIMTAMNKAEHRAKHWASDYKHTLQWDVKNDWQFLSNTWTPVPFSNEILRTHGAQNLGTSYNNAWSFTPNDDNAGVWWVHAFVMIRLLSTSAVDQIRMAVFINNIQFRHIDMVDEHMMGENKIRDGHLLGGCHVPLRAGDKMEIRLFFRNPMVEDMGVLYPTSLYGYVTAHRENCETNITGNATVTGQGYVFS